MVRLPRNTIAWNWHVDFTPVLWNTKSITNFWLRKLRDQFRHNYNLIKLPMVRHLWLVKFFWNFERKFEISPLPSWVYVEYAVEKKHMNKQIQIQWKPPSSTISWTLKPHLANEQSCQLMSFSQETNDFVQPSPLNDGDKTLRTSCPPCAALFSVLCFVTCRFNTYKVYVKRFLSKCDSVIGLSQ